MKKLFQSLIILCLVVTLVLSSEGSLAINYPSTAKTSVPKEKNLGTAKKITKKRVTWKKKKAKRKRKKTKKSTYINTLNIDVYTEWEDGLSYNIEEAKNKKVTSYYKKGKRNYKQRICKYTDRRTTIYKHPKGEYALGIALGEKTPSWLVEMFYNHGMRFYLDPELSRYSDIYNPNKYAGVFEGGYGITLRNDDDSYTYHEIGHMLSYLVGGAAYDSEFESIFNKERYNLPTDNAKYGASSIGEFFAEAYKGYVLSPSKLKKSCPLTYSYVHSVLNNAYENRGISTFSDSNLGGEVISCPLL